MAWFYNMAAGAMTQPRRTAAICVALSSFGDAPFVPDAAVRSQHEEARRFHRASGIRRINVTGHDEIVVDAIAAESDDRRHGKGCLVPCLSDWVPSES